jgi:hypothetical protein
MDGRFARTMDDEEPEVGKNRRTRDDRCARMMDDGKARGRGSDIRGQRAALLAAIGWRFEV